MSAERNWLIVRRGAWGARIVRRETEFRGRITGWDIEQGARWEGPANSVLARHGKPETAQAALARVRRTAGELKAEVDKQDRAARRARRLAEVKLQREAERG